MDGVNVFVKVKLGFATYSLVCLSDECVVPIQVAGNTPALPTR